MKLASFSSHFTDEYLFSEVLIFLSFFGDSSWWLLFTMIKHTLCIHWLNNFKEFFDRFIVLPVHDIEIQECFILIPFYAKANQEHNFPLFNVCMSSIEPYILHIIQVCANWKHSGPRRDCCETMNNKYIHVCMACASGPGVVRCIFSEYHRHWWDKRELTPKVFQGFFYWQFLPMFTQELLLVYIV